jgi:hypothetical protein
MRQHAPVLGWIVVAVIAAGFLIGGISLIYSAVWLFFIGVGIIVIGIIWSWSTHIVARSSQTFPGHHARGGASHD